MRENLRRAPDRGILSVEAKVIMVRLFTALLSLLVTLWLFSNAGAARSRTMTGTVVDWQFGQSIAISSGGTGPDGFRFRVRETVFEGDATSIRPGVRVTVWYKMLGERYPVAAKVRVLD